MRHLCLILSILGILGCSKKTEKSEPEPAAPSEAQAETQRDDKDAPAGEPAVVDTLEPRGRRIELRSAGEEPRQPLRWSFTPGAKYSLQVRSAETMRIEMELPEGEAMPPMTNPPVTFELSIEVREVTGDGTARAAFEVIRAQPQRNAAVSKEELDARRKALHGLAGLKGTYSVDSRGTLSDLELDRSASSAKQAAVDEVSRMLRWTTVSMPEEAVGQGAKWTVHEVLAEEGVETRRQTNIELVSLEGSRIELSSSTERAPARREADSEGSDASYEPKPLKSLESFRSEADLQHLVPIVTEVQAESAMATQADGPANTSQDVKISRELRASLRGSLVTD